MIRSLSGASAVNKSEAGLLPLFKLAISRSMVLRSVALSAQAHDAIRIEKQRISFTPS
jgi:hypothetical protein